MKLFKSKSIAPQGSVPMVHMSAAYGCSVFHLLPGHDYQICTSLDIGYFVFASGRLVFLPIELQNTAYTVYQAAKE